jgi:hypothetical protein
LDTEEEIKDDEREEETEDDGREDDEETKDGEREEETDRGTGRFTVKSITSSSLNSTGLTTARARVVETDELSATGCSGDRGNNILSNFDRRSVGGTGDTGEGEETSRGEEGETGGGREVEP